MIFGWFCGFLMGVAATYVGLKFKTAIIGWLARTEKKIEQKINESNK